MKRIFFLLTIVVIATACTNSNTNEYEEEYNFAEGKEALERGKHCPPADRNCNGVPDSEE